MIPTVKTPAKRKQHTKTVATKPQNRILTLSMNPTRNPFQSNTFHTRQTGINPTPHANPSNNPRLIPQFGSHNQPVSLVATTLDPTKHTVVFCSSQTLSQEDVRGVVTEHWDRQGPNPHHLVDLSNDHSTSLANEVENAHIHHVVLMSRVDETRMSDDDDSMVQETPLAMMAPVHGQRYWEFCPLWNTSYEPKRGVNWDFIKLS